MSSAEYVEMKAQMDRIESMLARLLDEPAPRPEPAVPVPPPVAVSAEVSEATRRRSVQEEGRWILATQGFEAYRRFWKEQSKQARQPRRKAA